MSSPLPLSSFITIDDLPPTSKVTLKLVVEVGDTTYQQGLSGNFDTVRPLVNDIYGYWHELTKKRRRGEAPGQRASIRLSGTARTLPKPNILETDFIPEENITTQNTQNTPSSWQSGTGSAPNISIGSRIGQRDKSPPSRRRSATSEKNRGKDKSPIRSPKDPPPEEVTELHTSARALSPIRKYLPEMSKSQEEEMISYSEPTTPKNKDKSNKKELTQPSGIGSFLSPFPSTFLFDSSKKGDLGVKDLKTDDDIIPIHPPGRKPNADSKRFIEVVSDHSEYEPGDEISGTVAISIKKPMTNVGSIVVAFKGIESCFSGLDMTNIDQAVGSFDSQYHTSLFICQQTTLWEAASLTKSHLKGEYCFPFSIKIPKLLPHSMRVHSTNPKINHLASVYYYVEAMTVPFDKNKKPSKPQETLLLSSPVEILLYGLHPEKLTKTPTSGPLVQKFQIPRAEGSLFGALNFPKPDIFLGQPNQLQLSLRNQSHDLPKFISICIEQTVFNIKDDKEVKKDRFYFMKQKELGPCNDENLHVRCLIDTTVQNYQTYYSRQKDVPLIPDVTGLNLSITHFLLIIINFPDSSKKDSIVKFPIKVWETLLSQQ